jgi:hypothetical protein
MGIIRLWHSGVSLDEELALHEEVTALTMKVARPLVWHDIQQSWPKRLLGGSCFILRFDAGLIGVTAEHVIKAFEGAKIQAASTVCLLRTVRFDLTGTIIDRDADLDIATFSVTENQLIESEAIAVDCRSAWPPPVPDNGRELSLAGFPEELKKESSYRCVEFRAYVSLSRVEDITDRDIITTFEPLRDTRVRAAPELPGLGANLSGCSGGPVLMHAERNGLHRWFPVGLIVRGPRDCLKDATREYDIFRFRRIHFVNPDGSINHQNIGWLP